MELKIDKEYWIKAKYKKTNDFNEYPFWFEAVDALDGMVMLKNVSEVKEVIPEREKVTIPKEVAEWIVGCREHGYDFAVTLDEGVNDSPEDVWKWLGNANNQDTFARAWLDGYEIEEPLYWVRNKEGRSLLVRGHSAIEISSASSVNYQENHAEHYTFTEKEIKDYDERYWAFAVSVEEEE